MLDGLTIYFSVSLSECQYILLMSKRQIPIEILLSNSYYVYKFNKPTNNI